MGYFGLVLDGLVSARVVTAQGKVVEVSETKNSDLFWGIRGAGANFGIITSATYKLHKMADHNNGRVLNADFIFPANNTEKYFKYLESWSGKIPANVAAISLINYNDLAGEVIRAFSQEPLCKFLLTRETGPGSRQLGIYRT